jgi:hypothetical protein
MKGADVEQAVFDLDNLNAAEIRKIMAQASINVS